MVFVRVGGSLGLGLGLYIRRLLWLVELNNELGLGIGLDLN